MSYNCDTWKVKEIVDLKIPVASLYKHERSDWHPEQKAGEDGVTEFEIMEDVVIRGKVTGGVIAVLDIQCRGEGSGAAMNWIIEPALKDSTGRLVVSCVWEGGDTINRLIVKDGIVKWEDIEI